MTLARIGPTGIMTLPELQDRRHHGLVANQNSKQRMTREGRIIRNEWHHVWPDLSVTETEPSVEGSRWQR